MNEETLNASEQQIEEVVQPQNNGADDTEVSQEEVTNPLKNVDDMSDEEFTEYLNSVQNGTLDREVQADKKSDNADKGNDEDAADDSNNETGNTEPDDTQEEKPFKVFGSQEEYQGEIDRIIGSRLKKNRESMNTLDKLKAQALNYYGGDDGDDALSQLIEDLQSQNAERQGISIEDYNKQTQDSIDAEKYRTQISQEERRQQQIADIQERWRQESEQMKAAIPDFDFNKAMQNKAFYDSIVSGASVSMAYLKAQKAMPAEKVKRKPIKQNGADKKGGIGKVERNIETMSDADFNNYIEKLKG